ncbi:hypothetical protein AB9M93_25425 [Peribacillus frigoritolerans]|uniref:hypothetical protein n=1 Tax=Peribacillus frigoritolerans TaxID=450367 RepID=UPI0035173284
MPIQFDYKITPINSGADIERFMSRIRPLPQQCPVCTSYISPHYLLLHEKFMPEDGEEQEEILMEVLCGCPRVECNSLFFAVYRQVNPNPRKWVFEYCYPSSKDPVLFEEEINKLSPKFVEVFNQARHAEKEGLNHICGVGYRKALEFLIKDFVILMNPDDEIKIKKMLLKQCVTTYIDSQDIVDLATKAIYVGNDETHYERRHKDRDIQDLKELIDLTVFYIALKLKAKRYKEGWKL